MQESDWPVFESELLDLIYGAAMGVSAWSDFLHRLNGRMNHARTTFLVLDGEARRSSLALSVAFTDSEARDYNSHYGAINPWTPSVTARPVGVGVTADSMLPTESLRQTEFYNDFLGRIGLEGGVGLTIERTGSRSVLLSSLCSRSDLGDMADYAALFTRLSPHLKRALDLYDRRLATTAVQETHILDCIDSGVIVFDESGKIAYANEAAKIYLQKDIGVRVNVLDRLAFDDDALSQALRAVREGARHSITRRRHTPFGVVDLTLLCRRSEFAIDQLFDRRFVLLITLVSSDLKKPLDGLTKREQEVAKAILEGLTNGQIAVRQGVSLETVRSQTKSIYQKLGISGRLDLIRLFTAG